MRSRRSQNFNSYWDIPTIDGMSGSAVWHDANGPYIFGIHAYGTHGAGNHALYNHGVRLVTAVYDNLVAWRNAP